MRRYHKMMWKYSERNIPTTATVVSSSEVLYFPNSPDFFSSLSSFLPPLSHFCDKMPHTKKLEWHSFSILLIVPEFQQFPRSLITTMMNIYTKDTLFAWENELPWSYSDPVACDGKMLLQMQRLPSQLPGTFFSFSRCQFKSHFVGLCP